MGTIAEDLTGIKNIEDTLTSNKVATFAYTEQAYQNNDANGVTLYDVDKPQNIPVAQPNILKVNETILAKGWRSQASSIPRMLMNHFLGRCSYNLNKINDLMSSLLTTLLGHLGTANGIATLDASGKLPSGQIPTSVVQSVNSHSPSNGNVDISKSDVGLGSVVNTGDSATPAQYGTEKFTTGGAYTLRSGLASDMNDIKQELSSDIDDVEQETESLKQDIIAVDRELKDHVDDENNPHNVTKSQVGLGNVINTGDSSTPEFQGTEKFTTGGAYILDGEIRDWVQKAGSSLGIAFRQYFWDDDHGSRDVIVAEDCVFALVCLHIINSSYQDCIANFTVRRNGVSSPVKLFVVGTGWVSNMLVRLGTEQTILAFMIPPDLPNNQNVWSEVGEVRGNFIDDYGHQSNSQGYEHGSEHDYGGNDVGANG